MAIVLHLQIHTGIKAPAGEETMGKLSLKIFQAISEYCQNNEGEMFSATGFYFWFCFLISDIAKLMPLSMWALKEKWKSLDTSYLFF